MKTSAAIVLGGALVACVLAGCGGDGGGGGGNDGVISFTAAVFRQNEDGSPGMDVTLERVGGSGAVGVTVTFTGGTATGGGVDYDSTPIVVSWAAGDLANKVVTVPLVDDNIDEQPAENVDLELTNPTGGATLGLSDAVLNINDDDIAGTVQFDMSAFNMSEGVAGGSVIVTRTGGLDGDISVTVTSIDGTANSDPMSMVEPVDYQPINTIAFFADQSSTPVIIPVMLVDDLLPELDETFTITLSNPTGGADIGAAASAVVTIVDDENVLQIENPALATNGLFGSSVAKIGPRIAVGAPGNLSGAGQVYAHHVDSIMVHDTHDGGPFAQSFGLALSSLDDTLAIGGLGAAWSFGGDSLLENYAQRFVVISLDDGFGEVVLVHPGSRLVVGAPRAQLGGSIQPSGRVYTYDAVSGAPLPALDGVADNRFGSALASFGGELLVGAPGNQGAVAKFAGPPWVLNGVILNPFPQMPSTAFGGSVAANPTNGAIVIGEPDGDLFQMNEGRIHIVDALGSVPILPPGLTVANGRFGATVFVTTAGKICVQQPGASSGSGRVFVFDSAGGLLGALDSPVPSQNAGFGSSICEFDGVLVIGAPRSPGLVQSGRVFIMKLP